MNKVNIPNLKNLYVLLFFALLSTLLISKQRILQLSILSSIKLCLNTIIPAIFPFMILSDYFVCNIQMHNIRSGKIILLFEKMFNIERAGFIPFLVGNICGFPIGSRLALQLQDSKYISKEECETLIPISSNPSLAFVVSGVGAGMRSSVSDGIILYFSVLVATILSGIIWREKRSASKLHGFYTNKSFSVIDSIKNAAFTSIIISSYIIFFSMVIDLIKSFNILNIFVITLASILEIGNATNLISTAKLPANLSLPLTAFSLGFSGISVYMQTKALNNNITFYNYSKVKLTEGLFAFVITYSMMLII